MNGNTFLLVLHFPTHSVKTFDWLSCIHISLHLITHKNNTISNNICETYFGNISIPTCISFSTLCVCVF